MAFLIYRIKLKTNTTVFHYKKSIIIMKDIMKSSSIGYFRLEQIRELFPLLQMRIVYLCLLKNNMAVFFNNATNILYNEGTFLR